MFRMCMSSPLLFPMPRSTFYALNHRRRLYPSILAEGRAIHFRLKEQDVPCLFVFRRVYTLHKKGLMENIGTRILYLTCDLELLLYVDSCPRTQRKQLLSQY